MLLLIGWVWFLMPVPLAFFSGYAIARSAEARRNAAFCERMVELTRHYSGRPETAQPLLEVLRAWRIVHRGSDG